MSVWTGTIVTLRNQRQLTLPREVCEELGIKPGDRLELKMEGGALMVKPARDVALDALSEIRKAFRNSSMTEKKLLEAGRCARRVVASEAIAVTAKSEEIDVIAKSEEIDVIARSEATKQSSRF